MTPGIHNLTNEVYHASPGVSKTGLFTIHESTPAHFKFADKPSTAALDIGQCWHTAIFEPELLDSVVVRGPPDRGNSNVWKDAALQAKENGLIILKPADHDRIQFMRDAAERCSTLVDVRKKAMIETAGYAIDPTTGVLVKCKPDCWNGEMGIMLDGKSVENGSPAAFARSVANYGWNFQEGFYTDVWNLANGRPVVNGFLFIAQEKERPWLTAPYELHPNAVEEGRAAYRSALTTYAECLQNEAAGMAPHLAWPGYPDRPEPLDLPRWAYRHTIPNQEFT